MSTTRTLRERRHQQTRTELINSALSIIEQHGVDAATIDRVGAGAGISRGTIYAHFPAGRTELLQAAYAQLSEQLVSDTHDALRSAPNWHEALNVVAEHLLRLSSSGNTGHFYNVTGPTLVTEGTGRGIGSSATRDMITEIIEAAQALHTIDGDVNGRDTAWLLVGALREIAGGVAAGLLNSASARQSFSRLISGFSAAQS